MDALSIIFILIFSIAALVPAIWASICLIKGKRQYWPAIVGILWAVLLMSFFFISMSAEWGGCDAENAIDAVKCDTKNCKRPDPWGDKCNTRCPGVPEGSYCQEGKRPVFDFCEKFAEGNIKQPWSTWSDLAFIAAGLWILLCLSFFNKTYTPNPMCGIGWLSVTYGIIIIFMGPPSMLLHASMKSWGSWLDFMSVIVWLSFNAAYVFYFCFWASCDKGREGHYRTLGVLLPSAGLVFLLGILAWFKPESHIVGYFVAAGLWGLFEFYFFFFRPLYFRIFRPWDKSVKYRRILWVFIINLGVLALTMTTWSFFNANVVSDSFCQKLESYPGHAFFHIFASFATITTFISFATEREKS